MSRQLKFRGKREDNGEWVFGHFVKSVNDRAYIIIYATEDAINTGNEIDFIYVEVTPETVGQFTGLYDKNGVEIYEGNVVFIKGEDNKGTIVWDSEELEYGVDMEDVQIKLGCFYGRDLEVIGNIHNQEESRQ